MAVFAVTVYSVFTNASLEKSSILLYSSTILETLSGKFYYYSSSCKENK